MRSSSDLTNFQEDNKLHCYLAVDQYILCKMLSSLSRPSAVIAINISNTPVIARFARVIDYCPKGAMTVNT